MITKNNINLIRSLSFKKNREKHNLFIVEGQKNVSELISSDYEIKSLFATNNWISKNPSINAIEVTDSELKKISNQKNPNNVLALAKTKNFIKPKKSGIILVLDDLNDPGNLGTIIRVSDWFGIKTIVCSENTVDRYNPKVVQASMGSLFRVKIIYTNLVKYLKTVKSPIYEASLKGINIKKMSFPKDMHLVLGNEANGIKKEIAQFTHRKIKINNISKDVESLNVAIATSIILHEIKG